MIVEILVFISLCVFALFIPSLALTFILDAKYPEASDIFAAIAFGCIVFMGILYFIILIASIITLATIIF